FLGALSQSRMILCIMGKDFVFNGEAQEIEVAKADIEACLNLKSEEEKQEVLGGFPATVKATRKASAPSAYGSGWDASIEITFPFGDTTTTEIVLLKDSDDVFGIAYNGA